MNRKIVRNSPLPLETTLLIDDFDEWKFRKNMNGEVVSEEVALVEFKREIMLCSKLPLENRLTARQWLIENGHLHSESAPALTIEESLVNISAKPFAVNMRRAVEKYSYIFILVDSVIEHLKSAIYIHLSDLFIGDMDAKRSNPSNTELVLHNGTVIKILLLTENWAIPDYVEPSSIGYRIVKNILDI